LADTEARRAELARQQQAAVETLVAAEHALAAARAEVARIDADLAGVADVVPRTVAPDDVHRVVTAFQTWRAVIAMVR
jgi:hypothetical protein